MKVLTIDFDIIMAPSIGLYNDLVPKMQLDDLVKMNKYIALSTIDCIHFKRLNALILYYASKLDPNNIKIIQDHEQLLDFIPKYESIDLINIDHHHDLGYDDKDYRNLKDLEPSCANWVKYLYDKNSLSSYIWFNNDNSSLPIHESNKNILTKYYPLSTTKELCEKIGEVDKMFICLSPPWIPPDIRPLFDIWVDELIAVCNYPFKMEPLSYTHMERLKRQDMESI